MMSGWGAKFFDFDNDGLLDLFVANGHPDDLIDKINPGVTYSEPLLLFQNTPTGLKNISPGSGPGCSPANSTREAWPSEISITMARSMS